MGRAFAPSYLAGEPAADAFFAPAFRDVKARIARTRAAAQRPVSAELLAILADQQASLPASPGRQAHWDTLASGKAAVVVTGQQVGLFLGPLYSFYKAASAIAVARALQAESGVPCVPVFWLQTEDHDFAEIRSATIADGEGQPVRLGLPDDESCDGRVSVAHRTLPAQVSELLDKAAEALHGPGTQEVLELLRDSYRTRVGLATAFASLLSSVFADDGLLVFNPRDARVAALAAPLYRRCIERVTPIEAGLRECEAALRAAGFAVQVPVREQGALVFFHRDGVTGPRFRIQRQEAGWRLAGTAEPVAHEALVGLLDEEPLRFSTSALLRPILQDVLFPTAAYVAGPGEINYYAQLGPLYAEADLVPPLLVPRGRFVVVDARTRRRLGQLGLSVRDLGTPGHELRARLQGALPADAPSPDDLRRLVATNVEPTVAQLASAVELAGVNLHRPAERTRNSVAHALERLITRYAHALLERDTVTRRRLHDVELALFPTGIPQERFFAWPALAARLGVRAFKDLVMERMTTAGPFATQVHELHP